MASFEILVDTGADLDAELQKRFDISVIKAHYSTPDGVEHDSFNEWKEVSKEAFYKDLRKNPKGYKTAPPSVGEFAERFIETVKTGKPIMFISISTGLSGTYDFALQGRELALKQYPDADIVVVDSLRFGPGYGLVAMHASMKRAEGYDIHQVNDWLETGIKQCIHQCGWLDDLKFVAATGRMNNAKAFFGTLAGIKPFGVQDRNGMSTVIGKSKGAKSAYELMLAYMGETAVDIENQIVVIATSDRRKQAEEFRDLLIAKYHPKEVMVNDVYPTNGINVGPGLMSAYYVGTEISEGLKRETEIVNKYSQK